MRRRQKDPLCARHAAERLQYRGVRCVLLWGALLLLSGCVPGRATTLASATPSASPTPRVLPTSVASLLDPAPTTCPSSPPLQTLSFAHFGGFVGPVTFFGGGPVWTGDFNPQDVLHVNLLGYTPWPGRKIVWDVGPNFSQPATIQVTNLQTGALAWWGNGGPLGGNVAQEIILDPSPTGLASPANHHESPEPGWQEWGSFVYILQAGCYAIQATWPGGHWRAIFAAGR